jgi:ribosomal protein S18 acetylase RimI-like enzyme
MVYGKAHRPFVYRTLFPGTVRAIAEITPESLKERISSAIQNRWKRNLDRLEWDTDYIYEYLVALALMFFCFFGFAFALRHLTKLFYDFPSFVADLAPVGGLIILPLFFRYYSYIYDPSTLLLSALAVGFIAARKHAAFYLIFVLATLNKETSILLTALFFLQEYKTTNKSKLFGHVLIQVSLWIIIRSAIVFVFSNNEGSLFEFHLLRNLGLIIRPLKLIYFIGVSTVFFILVRYQWRQKPSFLRAGLLVTLIPLVVLALFFGLVDEFRDYYEAFPFLFLLTLPTIVDIFGKVPIQNLVAQTKSRRINEETGKLRDYPDVRRYSNMLRLVQADWEKQLPQIRELLKEYAASLGFDLHFQEFDKELAELPGDYAAPPGRLLLAFYHDRLAGCVAIRKLSRGICEMKRLYVRPEFRGKGIGKKLAGAIIQEARSMGYSHMRLDTIPSMKEAITLYRTLGFQEIEPYRHNPIEGAKFMELALT